jgi:DNA-directed RNA polymerase subunit RPC12/RpoP
MSSPKAYRCLTCNAKPGEPCKRPSGHTIPFGDFHAGRRRAAGEVDGPLHPDGYIRPGRYVHGCGEPITLGHCADARASDGTRCSWDEAPCPRCGKRVWIEDLGPKKTGGIAPSYAQARLF